jgi:hypothetical protein
LTIPWKKVLSIYIEPLAKPNRKGDIASNSYAPTVIFTGSEGAERQARITEWSDKASAEGLVEWLHERLRLEQLRMQNREF